MLFALLCCLFCVFSASCISRKIMVGEYLVDSIRRNKITTTN